MFSLIITVIGIALVAALSIATLYYGGVAFNKSATEANATRILTESQQIMAAMELYRADHGIWPTQAQLLTPDSAGNVYLKAWPSQASSSFRHIDATIAFAANQLTWTILEGYPTLKYSGGVDEATCRSINLLSRGDNGILNKISTQFSSQCYETGVSGSGNYSIVVTKDPTPEVLALLEPEGLAKVTAQGVDSVSDADWAQAANKSKYSTSLTFSQSFQFGPIEPGASQTKSVSATNIGTGAIDLSNATFSSSNPSFTIVQNPGDSGSCLGIPVLAPGESCTLSVQFSTTQTGASLNGVISATVNNGKIYSVSAFGSTSSGPVVSSNGLSVSFDPNDLDSTPLSTTEDLYWLNPNSSIVAGVYVTNTGTTTLTNVNLTNTGTDFMLWPDYYTSPTCLQSMAPGAVCEFYLEVADYNSITVPQGGISRPYSTTVNASSSEGVSKSNHFMIQFTNMGF